MRNVLSGFREFITRGNVIDLAVAVVIGAAFTALVNAFTKALIDPLVKAALGGDGVHAGTIAVGSQTIDISLLVNAFITFLITAAVVYFLFVLPMNKYVEKFGKPEEEEKDPEELLVLREIRDELRARRDSADA